MIQCDCEISYWPDGAIVIEIFHGKQGADDSWRILISADTDPKECGIGAISLRGQEDDCLLNIENGNKLFQFLKNRIPDDRE